MNLDEFSTEIEGRRYLNPEVPLREQENFINNLRQSQADANKEIATQTYSLGTAVPSNLGGLTSPVGEGGSGDAGLSYFTSRYQTPQTNATVANLRATAQAQALNQVLQNEQEKWKKRYQDAYRAYQKRQYDASKTPQNPSEDTKGDVDEGTTDLTAQGKLILDSPDDFVPEGSRIVDPETGRIISDPGALVVEPGSGNIIGEGFSGNNPRYVRQADGSYKKYTPSNTTRGAGWLDLGGLLTNYWKPSDTKRISSGGR